MLPLILLCILAVVGVTATCVERLRLADVAHVAARTASTADDPVGTVEQIARDHDANAVSVIDPTGTYLTVTVHSDGFPLIPGFVMKRIPLAASTTVALEQSPVLE